jgi:plastocyanin
MPRISVHSALLAATVTALAAFALPRLAHDSPTTAAAVKTHTVKMGEYFYRPKTRTIAVGDRVRFRNVGKIEHTVADTTRGGRIRSRIIKPRALKPGDSQTARFTRRGTVRYVCTFHPRLMRGMIVVR